MLVVVNIITVLKYLREKAFHVTTLLVFAPEKMRVSLANYQLVIEKLLFLICLLIKKKFFSFLGNKRCLPDEMYEEDDDGDNFDVFTSNKGDEYFPTIKYVKNHTIFKFFHYCNDNFKSFITIFGKKPTHLKLDFNNF